MQRLGSQRSIGARAATAVLVLLLALAGCDAGGQTAASGEPRVGGTVTVGVEGEPAGQFNIHSSAADVAASTLRVVFDSLIAQDAKGDFHPWLAKSWEVSPDGLGYTFVLRDDVRFTDGEIFDAAAVKANFDHVVDPKTASQYGAALLGGSAYDRTEVIDAHTVKIVLKQPFAPLLQGLSTTYLGFISPKVLASSADKLAAGGPEVTVGTGPYRLERYVAGQELAFVRNDDYRWGPGNVTNTGAARPERLVLRVLPESAVRAGALTSGEVDIATNLTPSDAAELERQAGFSITATPSPGLPYTLFLNQSHGILGDEDIRLAVLRGINIDAAVAAVYGGKYQRAWSVLGPTTPNAYDPSLEGTWPYDQQLAASLLDKAGWTGRDAEGYRVKDGRRLSLSWLSTAAGGSRENRGALAEAFQADLKKLGVELKLTPVEIGTYLKQLKAGEYDIIDWSFVRPDADILRLHLFSKFAPIQNASYVADPQVDEWVTEAARTTDPKRRAELYGKVQHWAIEHAAMVPVYVSANLIGSSSQVSGLRTDPLGWPWYYDVWTARS